MMWNKLNIFEPSGCISREALDAFLKDELSPDVWAVAKEHIASCEFCSDALEGFRSIGLPQASVAMRMVDRSFKEKYLEPPKKNNRRITWFSIVAAASVLLLSGLFFFLRDSHPKTQLAENTVPIKEKASEPEMPGSKVEQPRMKNAPVVSENKAYKKSAYTEDTQSPKVNKDESPVLEPGVPAKAKELKKPNEQETHESLTASSDVVIEEQDNKKTSNLSSSNRRREAPVPSSTSEGKAMRSYSNNAESVEKSAELKAKKGESEKDYAFTAVDENASFQGGDVNKFKLYLNEQLSKSDASKNNNLDGKGVVQFTIDQKGKVTDITILRSLSPEIDKEIIRILKNSPRWTPGKRNGQAVKQQFMLPLKVSSGVLEK